MVQKVFTIRYDNKDEKNHFQWKCLKVVFGFLTFVQCNHLVSGL